MRKELYLESRKFLLTILIYSKKYFMKVIAKFSVIWQKDKIKKNYFLLRILWKKDIWILNYNNMNNNYGLLKIGKKNIDKILFKKLCMQIILTINKLKSINEQKKGEG